MRAFRSAVLILVQLWALAGTWAPAAAPGTLMKILSLNCSPQRPGVVYDGEDAENLGKVPRGRIAAEILQSGADVVLLQGLWVAGDSSSKNMDGFYNKEQMAQLLKPKYPYCLALDRINDGLLIASKYVPFYFGSATFDPKEREVYKEDNRVQKGALMAGLYDPAGNFLVVVNTHLQSGVNLEACMAREKEARNLGYWIERHRKADWRISQACSIVAGDFSEPVTLQRDQGRIVDRTRYLTEQMTAWYAPVDHNQALAALCQSTGAKDVVAVNRIRELAFVRKLGLGEPVATLRHPDPLVQDFNADGGWAYLKEATDASGRQIRTHFFFSPGRFRLISLTSLRGPYLGDQGPAKPYDPGKALTRNAAVLAEIELIPSPIK